MAKRRHIHLSLAIGDIVVDGEQMPMPETGDVQSMWCPECLVNTHKTVFAEIIQFGIIDDQHYIAVSCDKCGQKWTASFALEHWQYGTID